MTLLVARSEGFDPKLLIRIAQNAGPKGFLCDLVELAPRIKPDD